MGQIRHCAASWAFVGLHLLSRPTAAAAQEMDRQERILLGAAQLLGLVIEKAQRRDDALEERVRRAENELKQMKLIRAEDAKANEKVVSIFSSHEQSWVAERKRLGLQIRALATQLQSLKSKNEENVSNLNYRISEAEREIQAKNMALEQETAKRKELEENLQSAKKEERDRLNEVQTHKQAFAELVSRQSQLKAEMACALEQADTAKQELDQVFEMKEEAVTMVDKLSDKIVKMQNDTEQKDKILSALLRKTKLEATEKQMLLKELKISKAKKKQAELEMEKWKIKWESRHKKGSRSSYSVEAGCSEETREDLQIQRSRIGSKTLLHDYFESEWEKEQEFSEETRGDHVIAAIKCLDQYSNEDIGNEIVTHDIEHLQDWVRMETEKYATILEQKHFSEIDAFSEQMRLKDEKLEAFRWRLLSKDMESKRLLSQIEVLEEKFSQLREENFKLGTLLLDREGEIKSLKDQVGFFLHQCQSNSSKLSPASSSKAQAEINSGMRKESDMERDVEVDSARQKTYEEATATSNEDIQQYRDQTDTDIAAIYSADSPLSTDYSVGNSTICINEIYPEEAKSVGFYDEQAKYNSFVINSPNQEIEEEKEVVIDPVRNKESNTVRKLSPAAKSVTGKESSWKMDIHALGVSYKIKRLKQQLLVLEKLSGMKQNMICDDAQDSPNDKKADDNKRHLKGIILVIHLLTKQVKRFQSLEEKTNDLCRRMHESARGDDRRDSQNRKEQSRLLENFLEETFQVQRYMVATGQKLVDIQSKIASSVRSSDGPDESVGFNMEQFADVIRSLFRDIQRGLEVRISRIIGDLEGTLACDGIRHI